MELFLLLLSRTFKTDLWREDILQISLTPIIHVFRVEELFVDVGAYAVDDCVWQDCFDRFDRVAIEGIGIGWQFFLRWHDTRRAAAAQKTSSLWSSSYIKIRAGFIRIWYEMQVFELSFCKLLLISDKINRLQQVSSLHRKAESKTCIWQRIFAFYVDLIIDRGKDAFH